MDFRKRKTRNATIELIDCTVRMGWWKHQVLYCSSGFALNTTGKQNFKATELIDSMGGQGGGLNESMPEAIRRFDSRSQVGGSQCCRSCFKCRPLISLGYCRSHKTHATGNEQLHVHLGSHTQACSCSIFQCIGQLSVFMNQWQTIDLRQRHTTYTAQCW